MTYKQKSTKTWELGNLPYHFRPILAHLSMSADHCQTKKKM